MLSKSVGLGILVVGSMTAAAGGAYLATRHNQADFLEEPVATFSEPAPTDMASVPPDVAPLVSTAAPAEAVEIKPAPATRTIPAKRRPVAQATPAHAGSNERDATPWTPISEAPPEPLAVNGETVADAAASTAVSAEPAPPQARFEEITIPSDTVIGVQVETAVSSERARVEDRVDGRVTRDVTVGARVAIPAGTRLLGSVTAAERGGKFKDRARVAVRFHTAMLADGTRLSLQTTAIMREGDSPSRESAAKVGGSAVGGAILGAILGGGKGAVIGGTAGAAGGSAVVLAGDRNAATLPAGTHVTIRLMSDVTVTVEK